MSSSNAATTEERVLESSDHRAPLTLHPEARYTLHPSKYTGPRAEDVLAQRQQHLSAGQYHFYKKPVMLVEASMQYCFDDKGKQYLDCYSNVCHVGHCHPHFVKQTSAAMHNIISNTRYLHPKIVEYAERLKAKFPPALNVCFFVNSGSEANDLAMRLARVHTNRHGVICLQNAYHGTTASCTGVSTSLSTGTSHGTVDYGYCARDIFVAPVPDPYRGDIKGDDHECGRKYAAYVGDLCNRENIAAFIHESVQGVGGQIVYPRDYLQRAYEHVRKAGGVCIADEVQTGFGRTGSHFWAFEAQGVVPDIVTLGKPIGNGFPLGAVITTRAIAQSFDGVQYFNTNGGNPVACAAGLAVLDIIDRDRLQQNALEVSHYLMEKLLALKDKHDHIGDVRGVGLFVGIELVKGPNTLEPATDLTVVLMEMLKDVGLLVGKGGQHNNVLRIKPPLCFNKGNCDYLVRALDELIPRAVRDVNSKKKEATKLLRLGRDSYINCATPGQEALAEHGRRSESRREQHHHSHRQDDDQEQHGHHGHHGRRSHSAGGRVPSAHTQPPAASVTKIPSGLRAVVEQGLAAEADGRKSTTTSTRRRDSAEFDVERFFSDDFRAPHVASKPPTTTISTTPGRVSGVPAALRGVVEAHLSKSGGRHSSSGPRVSRRSKSADGSDSDDVIASSASSRSSSASSRGGSDSNDAAARRSGERLRRLSGVAASGAPAGSSAIKRPRISFAASAGAPVDTPPAQVRRSLSNHQVAFSPYALPRK